MLVHSLFYRYSPKANAEIGKYAAQHGATVVVRKFSKQFGHPVRVSTVHSIKKAYVNELKMKQAMKDGPVEIKHLCPKKRGRRLETNK